MKSSAGELYLIFMGNLQMHCLKVDLSIKCPASESKIIIRFSQFKRTTSMAVTHSCFDEKYKMRAVQWENDFNIFFANNSQYIMIFSILQQRGDMLVVLGGHLVNIGDGYWWFKLNLLILC